MKLCAALGLGVNLWIASSSALAASPDSVVVEVTLAGSDDDVQALSSALHDALAAAQVGVHTDRVEKIEPRRVSRAGSSSSSAASAPHLWVDRTAADHATLYLTSADGSRVFVRNFKLERGLDPVALELLSLVGRSSVTAMLAGGDVGVSREEYERTLPRATSPTPASSAPDASDAQARPPYWHVGALYEAELLNAAVVQQGAGAELEWQLDRLSLGLVGELRAPLQAGSGPVVAHLTSRSANLFLALPVTLTEHATLSFSAAFGVDWIQVGGQQNAANASAEPTFSAAESVLRSLAAFRYRFGALELGAGLGLELGLVKARYFLLHSDGQQDDVFSPWQVRPLANLSLGARF